MKSLPERLKAELRKKRAGVVVSAESLAGLGSRAALDQALSRLTAKGELMRIARGAYVVPRRTEFGPLPPPAERVIRSFAKRTGTRIVPNGAVAANRFGLSTQQPMRRIYMTSGPSRKLALGANPVEMRHVPKWQTLLPGEPAGEALRAMAYLGRNEVGEAALELRRKLEPHQWEKLVRTVPKVPKWIAKAVLEADRIG